MEGNTDENNMDFSKLKVPELKKELKSRHLSTAGNKTELMERLLNYVKNKRDNGAIVDDLEEDLLNDEDDDHLDNDESDALLTDLEKTISESETPVTPVAKPQKRKSTNDTNKVATEEATKAKKITLTRKPSTGNSETAVISNAPEVSNDLSNLTQTPVNATSKIQEMSETSKSNGATRKVIKFSELSVQERLEMRSKKFGTPLSTDAVKQTRAERFGINNNNKQNITSEGGTASVDVLKQRAKRFGVSVSPSITKLENMERLERRKNRFGAGAVPTTVIDKETSTPVKPDADKAKAARLERFKN